MIFKSLYIDDGLSCNTFSFQEGVNLIHSTKNTVGKTTLLRLLLYSIGFSIPSTKKINFDRCTVRCVVENDSSEEIEVIRNGQYELKLVGTSVNNSYALPSELHDVHRILFQCDSEDISNNILGTFYVDQEKGWTLLNRGKVIGNIHFNIEALIRGLSEIDCEELLCLEKKITGDCERLRSILSVSEYQRQVAQAGGVISQRDYEDQIQAEIFKCSSAKSTAEKQLSQIEKIISDNRQIKKFIEEIKIMVLLPNKSTMRVTADNIVGLSDSLDYLEARKKQLFRQIRDLTHNIVKLKSQQNAENTQTEFWQSEGVLESFDHSIMRVPINAVAVHDTLKKKEEELKRIRKEISFQTRSNSKIIFSLFENMKKYAQLLGIASEGEEIAANFLFTSNLKELSGALLHKTVFAFRLAYILEVEKKLGIKLPIVLDSPKGKEVDEENVQMMMQILKSDFSGHQIIIASIYEYDLDSPNVIEIHDRLLKLKDVANA